MKRKSNQRITKIKLDQIEQLLKKAESISVEDGTIVQEAGSDLTPYPDMNKLRLWTRDYLLSGLTKLYPVDFTDDGQTLYTALIDGLPIFTKLTKSLTELEETEWTQPILSSNGTLGGNDYACLASTEQYPAYYAFNGNSSDYWGPSSTSVPQSVIFYSPSSIKLTSVYFNFKEDAEVYSAGTIEASNDNSTYTQVGSFSGNSSVGLTVYLDTQGKAYKYYKYTFTAHHGSYWGKANITQVGTVVSKVPVETTKPGLWLSNLVSPVSNSVAGGWLRHNLINEDSSDFMSVNNDTIGNYSYSFFQRGVIHRDAGSTHGDNDSFCMHWSPSALSCISHDAIVIPGNELQNTYTSYQTLVVPSNPDMQTYSEVGAKNVQFTFVDNNDNIPLSTTTFNGRLVGKDWTYEFTVKPNFAGSGSNYEGQVRCGIDPGDCTEEYSLCPECVSDDTRSNGVCIAGQITTGTGCVQNIDQCYVPYQAQQNPNANQSTSTPIKGTTSSLLSTCRNIEYISASPYDILPSYWYDRYNISVPNNTKEIYVEGLVAWNNPNVGNVDIKCENSRSFAGAGGDTVLCDIQEGPSGSGIDNAFIRTVESNILILAEGNIGSQTYTRDIDAATADGIQFSISAQGKSGQTLNGKLELYFKFFKASEPQENVNIYLHIRDLKAEYDDLGLPFPTDCSIDRFEVSTSTEPTTDKYTTDRLLYENVNINSLGDISGLGLNDINLNG